MGLPNSLNYILYDNPICKGTADVVVRGGKWIGLLKSKPAEIGQSGAKQMSSSASNHLAQLARSSGPFIRIAGLSGALAVALGAYGAHTIFPKDIAQDRKTAYETANRYHFFHTLALLGIPMCKRPTLSGCLMMSGMVIFCGSCYHYALTGDKSVKPITPYGGVLLIAAWLTLVL